MLVLLLLSNPLLAQNDINYFEIHKSFRSESRLHKKMLGLIQLDETLKIMDSEGFSPTGLYSYPEGVDKIADASLKKMIIKAIDENLDRKLLNVFKGIMNIEILLPNLKMRLQFHEKYLKLLKAKIEIGQSTQWDYDIAMATYLELKDQIVKNKTILALAKPMLSEVSGVTITDQDRIYEKEFLQEPEVLDLRNSSYYINSAQSSSRSRAIVTLLEKSLDGDWRFRLQLNRPYFLFTGADLKSGTTVVLESLEKAEKILQLVKARIDSNLLASVQRELLGIRLLASKMNISLTIKLATEEKLENLDNMLERGLIEEKEWLERKIQYQTYKADSDIAKLNYNVMKKQFMKLTGAFL